MKAERNYCLRLSLSFLLACCLVGAAIRVDAQQKDQKADNRATANKNACRNSESAKFTVQCKDKYFLGETPTITISITNTSRSPQKVKEAEHQKFSLEITGLFENDTGQYKKTVVWDGSWDLPKEPVKESKPGQVILFEAPRKREPKYVTLGPGESTTLTLDLPITLGSRLGVSKYKLIVKSEHGQTVVKDFEVYFDDEKSVPILAKMFHAQQKGQKGSEQVAANKNPCATSERAKFSVRCKARYFLGETPTITISITNTGRSAQTVKEAEHQKFSLEMTGIFENDTGRHTKKLVYDGSWDLPKQPIREPKRGELILFEALRKREPKFVKLAPGESTTLVLALSTTFGSYLGVGKYKMIVKSEDGQKVVKEFEVYFDDEKSFAYYAGHLKSDEELERTSAMYRLMEFSKTKAISMFKEYVKSDDEKQRDLGNWVLRKLKAGEFDALQIGVNIGDLNERLVLGQTPFVGIHIKNKGVVAKVVEAAECQQFSIELTGVFGNDSKQETKTCHCDGGEETPKQLDSFSSRAGKSVPTQQKPKLVKLGEYESTMIVLDLSKCSRHNFETGKYQLTVKSVDSQGILKEQEIVKNFEVYFDEGKSVQVFAELVRSDDIAKRDWAVIKLAQINRTKLITVLEELVKSGNQKQRDFAGGVLARIKAGQFGPDPGLANTKPSAE